MSSLGNYTFLPWLRQGIANRIADEDMDPAVITRASVNVTLDVTGTAVDGGADLAAQLSRDVELYGPGDVVGIDTKAIVKVEPRHWITNFETNYCPYIEFYDEDFPWRYTPSASHADNDSRLRPWIMLAILAEGEFEEGVGAGTRPLSFISVPDAAALPDSGSLWAWAHVHVNRNLLADDDVIVGSAQNADALEKFLEALNENPDLATSRILSPRHLQERTAYHAFLIPAFETGRLAGLGLDPAVAPFATHGAWDPYPTNPANKPEPTHLPYYHRWYFRTSTVGDFEYLVRLLEPKPMDSRVGRRNMDVQYPGSNVPGIDDPDLGGVLQLGGALRIPFDTLSEAAKDEVTRYESWADPPPHPFQTQLAAFVNLADDFSRKDAHSAKQNPDLPEHVRNDDDPDPLITPPLYGRWHARMRRLLTDADGDPLPQDDNWVHELNLDPRFRVTAGFGTDVVKANQEAYMDAAWEQVGAVLAANRKIRWGQLAKDVATIWHGAHLGGLRAHNPDRFVTLTAPVDKRVLIGGSTRFHTFRESVVPRTAVGAPMRRALRPRSRLVQRIGFTAERRAESLAARINTGEVAPAPPKIVPPSLPTLEDVAEELAPDVPDFIADLLRAAPWLYALLLLLALLMLLLGLLIPGLLGFGLAVGAILAAAGVIVRRLRRRQQIADSVHPAHATPESVEDYPPSPNFVLTPPSVDFEPARGGSDSEEATRFKLGLIDNFSLLEASRDVAVEPRKTALDWPAVVNGTFTAIDPAVTIPKRNFASIYIPPRIRDQLFETFDEVMAYPEIDVPMYKPLTDISAELFLPNMRYIEQNSISLLETNQRFIEAYMVGLNHEFARELLWREYPTDQRGSCFRQFWDVSSFLDRDDTDPEVLKEKLRDIPPLHEWSRFSKLSDHDHRELPGEDEEELVLVIRGELLKKYPTAVIYAHRAEWPTDENGDIVKSRPRRLVELTPAEADNPPDDKVRTPLYEAKVDPDIYFFGFDLTALEARGETEADPDDPGWFFVIKERPGEPRFGFDIDQDEAEGGAKHYWNDVSWLDVQPGGAPGDFLDPTAVPHITLAAPPGSATDDQKAQHEEDVQIQWTANVSSAELAYIMYQVPVLIAVHAAEMLPD